MTDMPDEPAIASSLRLASRAGLSVELNANGAVRRFDCGNVALALFVGNEVEGGPTNVYLRRHVNGAIEWTPLLGPSSPTRFHSQPIDGQLVGMGLWQGIRYSIALVLAQAATAWFWHVQL